MTNQHDQAPRPEPCKAVCIGECMVELARGPDRRFGLALGGDSFNTAVYLARAGVSTAYLTALGDDPYSEAILNLAAAENVDTSAIMRLPGRVPGLYLIETDEAGERTFYYWRETSPARDVFSGGGAASVQPHLTGAALIYFSGITLWCYAKDGLEAFLSTIETARARGAKIAFDSNYRIRLWGSDKEPVRTIFSAAIALADIVLPSLDDDRLLWGDHSAEGTLRRYAEAGVQEIAVKDGAGGVSILQAAQLRHVPVPTKINPVDTTAAGDSFNAAYLAARLAGHAQEQAVLFGHRLAAIVVSHRGAIVPHAATASLFSELRGAQPL